MVLITIVTGDYKQTYNWGAPHCRVLECLPCCCISIEGHFLVQRMVRDQSKGTTSWNCPYISMGPTPIQQSQSDPIFFYKSYQPKNFDPPHLFPILEHPVTFRQDLHGDGFILCSLEGVGTSYGCAIHRWHRHRWWSGAQLERIPGNISRHGGHGGHGDHGGHGSCRWLGNVGMCPGSTTHQDAASDPSPSFPSPSAWNVNEMRSYILIILKLINLLIAWCFCLRIHRESNNHHKQNWGMPRSFQYIPSMFPYELQRSDLLLSGIRTKRDETIGPMEGSRCWKMLPSGKHTKNYGKIHHF